MNSHQAKYGISLRVLNLGVGNDINEKNSKLLDYRYI